MNLTISPAAFDDVAPFMEMAGRYDTSAGMVTLQDIANVSTLYQVQDEQGKPVAGYALRMTEHTAGRVLWIMAAGGRLPGVDLSEIILTAVKHQAQQAGARQIAQITRRAGLVKKMKAQGFKDCGTVLRLNLK